jgi:hypothetical protein
MTIKRTCCTLLFILCLILAACQSDSSSDLTPGSQESPNPEQLDDAALGEPFTLAVGQSLAIGGTELTVTFDMVERDGRCPSAVNCAEEGPVVIVISVSAVGQTAETFEMNPDPQLAQFAGMPPNIVTYQGYEIELTAVDPFPEQPEDLMNLPYTATLIVRQDDAS